MDVCCIFQCTVCVGLTVRCLQEWKASQAEGHLCCCVEMCGREGICAYERMLGVSYLNMLLS